MTRSSRIAALVLVIGVVAASTPQAARAEGFISPYVGFNFGGDAEERSTGFGGSVGAISRAGIGFEVDFGYTPDFFQTEELLGVKRNVTTLMGNILFAPASSGAGIRPYVSGGFGLLRSSLSDASELFDDLSRNDFAVNAGGGLMADLSPSFGVRGDLRYVRSLQGDNGDDSGLPDFGFDLAEFNYWRGSIGVHVKF